MKTIRIRLKQSCADMLKSYEKGEELDWEFHDALRMIERGYAERVEPARR